jgi:hypothetical protein
MSKKTPEALFHYTVGPKLALIAASRHLMPIGYGMATGKREKPVLWFSENPQWEPTATKVISTDKGHSYHRPNVRELQERVGVFRFRLDTRRPEALREVGIKLVAWKDLPLQMCMDPKDVTLMIRSGVQLGATPTHWWGTMQPLPTALEVSGVLRLEIRRKAEPGALEGWEPIKLADGIAEFEAMGTRVKQNLATNTPKAMGL